jgi:hypothetical protein
LPGLIKRGIKVLQNFVSKLNKPLKISDTKLPKVTLAPLFSCPQSGQYFSCPLKGCPQFKQAGSLTLAIFFLDFVRLIIQVLLVEKKGCTL